MNEYDVAFKNLLVSSSDLLKGNGFKSKGPRMRRDFSEDIIHVFWFQRFPTPYIPGVMNKEMRINIGISSRKLCQELGVQRGIELPSEYSESCEIETTGGFLKYGKDKAQKYFPSDDVEIQKKEFRDQIQAGISWMTDISDENRWVEFFSKKGYWAFAAAAAFTQGKIDLAKENIDKEIESRILHRMGLNKNLSELILSEDISDSVKSKIQENISKPDSYVKKLLDWKLKRNLT
jgi:hypothetical protein